MLYRSKLWTCSETKKHGLTYKEALESEKKALKKADILYPNVWVKPTLEMIHYSTIYADKRSISAE
jgi:ornithine carbamoyltransferase